MLDSMERNREKGQEKMGDGVGEKKKRLLVCWLEGLCRQEQEQEEEQEEGSRSRSRFRFRLRLSHTARVSKSAHDVSVTQQQTASLEPASCEVHKKAQQSYSTVRTARTVITC